MNNQTVSEYTEWEEAHGIKREPEREGNETNDAPFDDDDYGDDAPVTFVPTCTFYTKDFKDFDIDPERAEMNLDDIMISGFNPPVSRNEFEKYMQQKCQNGEISEYDVKDNLRYYDYVIAATSERIQHPDKKASPDEILNASPDEILTEISRRMESPLRKAKSDPGN